MALKSRVWSAGKLLVLAGALVGTYLLFAAAAMRIAIKTREVTVPSLVGRTINEATGSLSDLGLALNVEQGRRLDPRIGPDRIVAQEPSAGLTARRGRSIKVWLSAGSRANTVPLLVGQTMGGAELRLKQDELDVSGISEIRSSDYPADTIAAQAPPPESRATSVSLLLNRAERSATYVMPDLIGVNGERAAEILRGRGFRVTVVGDHPYPGVPAGVVIRQQPQAGFQIAPGEPISLEMSR